ncbi:aminotransferase class V-fold PLP-dependent enzyme [Rudanella paleaurantiibacter]|uniref:Aminotransferase class V-fold PLP-dependent enzyme n=1 Tax=Rudanella paleaurantiibacter TaxID=2614655 RepID=A0A7J5U4P9_9BACT|nr:aminotransferase class V-fold PLP-dependent enzyme [Rudanella paleaurantiibacter]KAB7732673.1 aminotransferase class V-fold PLP-dependent enzyme [Rudanella paleaurantiibacter]
MSTPTNRRSFLGKLALAGGAFSANSLFAQAHAADWAEASARVDQLTPQQAATDEDYWHRIQQAYPASSSNILILNNGGVSPAPLIVQHALERYNALINQGPSYYMWRILDQGREAVRDKLALLAGTPADEIAINRNATEALLTVIYGLPLQRGDEVVGTLQDYPNVVQAWRQRASREGVVYKQLNFNFPIEDDDAIVRAYEKAITPRTKILHVTHVINWMGQILPVQKICRMAKQRGVEVLVDGAHSFGLLDFNIADLGCDYFGTSLHKFLSAPVGTGMLWIKQEKIAGIWPLLCNPSPNSADIRKFETLGTRSFAIEQGIGEALNFHNAIGTKRKEERIRYLKNYWAERVVNIPRVRLHTSLKAPYSCGICGVSVDGMTIAELESGLFGKYKINTSPTVWENISCVRVTPHVYTSLADLDRLVMAITQIAKSKS